MKSILYLFLFSVLVTVVDAQHQPVTKANYEQASRFSPDNLKRMVFSTKVEPHWLKNSSRFWYAYETSEGKYYYIVDPKLKSKVNCLITISWLPI